MLRNQQRLQREEQQRAAAAMEAEIARKEKITKAAEAKKIAKMIESGEMIIASDDDTLCWVKFIERNRFALKHQFDDAYEFLYNEKDLTNYCKPWLLETCRLNPGKYIYINDEEDTDPPPETEIIAVKYVDNTWEGKLAGYRQQQNINLSASWMSVVF